MRGFLLPAITLALIGAASAADAKVSIVVDKDNQQMTVSVDGVERYRWPVSTGIPSYETPNGSFRTFRMEEDHYSKEFDDAPMPHAIFFTKAGHAIHGTDSESRLGMPASHGCVRLSRANASKLWDLVKADGVLNATVTLTGSSQVALARTPKRNVAVARRAAPPRDYDGTVGEPVDIAPQPRAWGPQVADDGYIYPADGSAGRYPAPRGYRRYAAPMPQQQYYYAPQVYPPRGYYRRSYDGFYGD